MCRIPALGEVAAMFALTRRRTFWRGEKKDIYVFRNLLWIFTFLEDYVPFVKGSCG